MTMWLGLLGCVALAAQFAGLLLFWFSYRHIYPIANKRPFLSLLNGLAFLLPQLKATAEQFVIETTSCPLSEFIILVIISLNFDMIALRLFNLYLSHTQMKTTRKLADEHVDAVNEDKSVQGSLTREATALGRSHIEISESAQSVLRRSFFLRDSFALGIVAFDTFLCGITIVSMTMSSWDYAKATITTQSHVSSRVCRGYNAVADTIFFVFLIVSLLAKTLIITVFVFKTKSNTMYPDTVGLKKELHHLLMMTGAFVTLFASELFERFSIPKYIPITLACMSSYSLTIVVPMLEIYRRQRGLDRRNKSRLSPISSSMRASIVQPRNDSNITTSLSLPNMAQFNPLERFISARRTYRDAFAIFLQSEFALQNLAFWEEAIKFRSDFRRLRGRPCNVHFWNRAVFIYRYHIRPLAPLQVYLPAAFRAELSLLLKDAKPTVIPVEDMSSIRKQSSSIQASTHSRNQNYNRQVSAPIRQNSQWSLPINPDAMKHIGPDLFEVARRYIGDMMNREALVRFLNTQDSKHVNAWNAFIAEEKEAKKVPINAHPH